MFKSANVFMKKLSISLAMAAMFATCAAQAAVVDYSNVGGLTTFQDTNTGRVWLDMNNFFNEASTTGTTGNDMIAIAAANGFTFANSTDVHQLLDSLSLSGGTWSSYASIMGYGKPRNLIWGMYDDGNGNPYAYAWSFSGNSSWNYCTSNCTNADYVQNFGSSGAVDMGIWAYRTEIVAAVPEPETYAMLLAGLGLVGFAARRRQNHVA